MATLQPNQLYAMGFAAFGENVQISDKASFYGSERIRLGNHVRIDDFCVISAGEGGICIGNFVHISTSSLLIGRGAISLQDFSGLSSRVSVHSSSDDYSGIYMTNPTVPDEYTGATHAAVTLERHVIVGSGSVILPGVTLREGAAVGALSVVREDCESFSIYAGNPARRISARKRDFLDLEAQLLRSTTRAP